MAPSIRCLLLLVCWAWSASCTIEDVRQPEVIQFDQHIHQCVVDRLNLDDLVGGWRLAHYSKKPPDPRLKVRVTFTRTGAWLNGVLTEDGAHPYVLNLTSSSSGPAGLLMNILTSNDGTETQIPVLVLAAVRRHYLSVLQLGNGRPDVIDWAIYVSTDAVHHHPSLSKKDLDDARAGFDCLGLGRDLYAVLK